MNITPSYNSHAPFNSFDFSIFKFIFLNFHSYLSRSTCTYTLIISFTNIHILSLNRHITKLWNSTSNFLSYFSIRATILISFIHSPLSFTCLINYSFSLENYRLYGVMQVLSPFIHSFFVFFLSFHTQL